MRRIGVVAATDVTGFGLLGHLGEMARASWVSAESNSTACPCLTASGELSIADGCPGGSQRNLTSPVSRFTPFGERTDRAIIARDAQTSGGLLIAVDAPLRRAVAGALSEEDVSRTRDRQTDGAPFRGWSRQRRAVSLNRMIGSLRHDRLGRCSAGSMPLPALEHSAMRTATSSCAPSRPPRSAPLTRTGSDVWRHLKRRLKEMELSSAPPAWRGTIDGPPPRHPRVRLRPADQGRLPTDL